MPFNSRQVREYAGGSSIGGILRKSGSSTGTTTTASSLSTTTTMGGATTAAGYCGETKQIDLLVFGYACKIFRDDDKAREIDQGKHLIPWMGDSSLKIDRLIIVVYFLTFVSVKFKKNEKLKTLYFVNY